MQTLALTLAAVGLSLAVGMPLGVLAGRSDRFNRGITPVLDGMQIIPAFAYLMPVVILFSVGPGAASWLSTDDLDVRPAVRDPTARSPDWEHHRSRPGAGDGLHGRSASCLWRGAMLLLSAALRFALPPSGRGGPHRRRRGVIVGQERACHESRPRSARRGRFRDHGDRARTGSRRSRGQSDRPGMSMSHSPASPSQRSEPSGDRA